MIRKKITQHEAIFYQLYKKRKVDPNEYTPIWQLIGEVYCEELRVWGFVSYEVSARMSELYKDNPSLFERVQVTGKTGATYYAYRIAVRAKANKIANSDLLRFFQEIKGYESLTRAPLAPQPVPATAKDWVPPTRLPEPVITRIKGETYPYKDYIITDFGTSIECSCPSYQFKKSCKHILKRRLQIQQSMQQPIF